jgi:hypothetical protein
MDRFLGACGLLLLGCTASEPDDGVTSLRDDTYWVSLAAPDGWIVATDDDDPLPEHRPEPVVCSPHPWHVVGEGIEADTTECNYVSLTTPLTHDIEAGQPIAVDVWWSTLASVEPATGHLALFVGGQRLWETEVQIPGPADVRQFEFASPFSATAGEDVVFHLHNHGFNTWTLARFATLASSDETP